MSYFDTQTLQLTSLFRQNLMAGLLLYKGELLKNYYE
jgi:hypothetical protein